MAKFLKITAVSLCIIAIIFLLLVCRYQAAVIDSQRSVILYLFNSCVVEDSTGPTLAPVPAPAPEHKAKAPPKAAPEPNHPWRPDPFDKESI